MDEKGSNLLFFVLPHTTWWKNFQAVKINEAFGKRIWKGSLKDGVRGSERTTSIRILSSEIYHVYKH